MSGTIFPSTGPTLTARRRPADCIARWHGVLQSYHGDVDRPVVFDKSRGWPAYIEMLESALGRKVKVLVPVRNLSDVLASFEKLHRKAVARNGGGRPPGETAQNYYQMQTVVGRCEWWMREDQPVGLAYVRICDALARGLRDRLHFVVAEELTRRPAEIMKGIYDFLGERNFAHDFEHVEQVTREDDGAHGFEDLHTIRPRVEPIESSWRHVLGPVGEKWARAHQGLVVTILTCVMAGDSRGGCTIPVRIGRPKPLRPPPLPPYSTMTAKAICG